MNVAGFLTAWNDRTSWFLAVVVTAGEITDFEAFAPCAPANAAIGAAGLCPVILDMPTECFPPPAKLTEKLLAVTSAAVAIFRKR